MIQQYFNEIKQIVDQIDKEHVQRMVDMLNELRQRNGRLFILGVGGSAGNASHAVNDFRKLCNIQAFTPTDNVSELTARINDDGWETSYGNWLVQSEISSKDAVMIFSVGGGDLKRKISVNICDAIDVAKKVGAKVLGIVGRKGGYTLRKSDCSVLIPPVNPNHITPHTEAFQSILHHLIVWVLKVKQGTWESIK